MSGASVVSARSACHKKDIYVKTFVHSLFTMAGQHTLSRTTCHFLVRVACRKVGDSALCVVLSSCLVKPR